MSHASLLASIVILPLAGLFTVASPAAHLHTSTAPPAPAALEENCAGCAQIKSDTRSGTGFIEFTETATGNKTTIALTLNISASMFSTTCSGTGGCPGKTSSKEVSLSLYAENADGGGIPSQFNGVGGIVVNGSSMQVGSGFTIGAYGNYTGGQTVTVRCSQNEVELTWDVILTGGVPSGYTFEVVDDENPRATFTFDCSLCDGPE